MVTMKTLRYCNYFVDILDVTDKHNVFLCQTSPKMICVIGVRNK